MTRVHCRPAPTRRVIVGSQAELARLFQVTPAAVEKWRAQGMPGSAGKWDLAEVLRWMRTRIRRRIEREIGGEVIDFILENFGHEEHAGEDFDGEEERT